MVTGMHLCGALSWSHVICKAIFTYPFQTVSERNTRWRSVSAHGEVFLFCLNNFIEPPRSRAAPWPMAGWLFFPLWSHFFNPTSCCTSVTLSLRTEGDSQTNIPVATSGCVFECSAYVAFMYMHAPQRTSKPRARRCVFHQHSSLTILCHDIFWLKEGNIDSAFVFNLRLKSNHHPFVHIPKKREFLLCGNSPIVRVVELHRADKKKKKQLILYVQFCWNNFFYWT